MEEVKTNKIDFPTNKNKEYVNSRGEPFVIKQSKIVTKETSNGKTRRDTYYLASFVNTGYEKWCLHGEVTKGTIKDKMSPSVCKVGIIGEEITNPQKHYLYNRWRDMLRRCYDENSANYKTYGAVGCYVCEEWKYFPNFVRDIENKENSDKLKVTLKNPKERYEIDKDILKKGNKVYCDKYTLIVPHKENIQERNIRYNFNKELTETQIIRISKDFNEILRFNSVSEGLKSVNGVNVSAISDVCSNRGISYRGYYWQYDNGLTDCEIIQNIKNRIALTKNFRADRHRKNYLLVSDEGEVFKDFKQHTLTEIANYLGVSISSVRMYMKDRKYNGKYKLIIEETDTYEQ